MIFLRSLVHMATQSKAIKTLIHAEIVTSARLILVKSSTIDATRTVTMIFAEDVRLVPKVMSLDKRIRDLDTTYQAEI